MRALTLGLWLVASPSLAGDTTLWTALRDANVVVVATVARLEGKLAVLEVEQPLKGRLPASLTVRSFGDADLRAGTRAVFALRVDQPTAAVVKLPSTQPAPPAERLATILVTAAERETVVALMKDALRRQQQERPLSSEWATGLTRLAATRYAGLELLEQTSPLSDELRVAAADVVLSGDYEGILPFATLHRWLAIAGYVREDEVNAAALDTLERSRARPEKGLRGLERLALETLAQRVEAAPASALADANRQRLRQLAAPR